VGLNLGAAAGGSLSEHLHQHVVPRWSGDANFMPVLAGTKAIMQTLGDTRQDIAEAWPA
jgi:ATP adenylyltransferase